MFRLISAIPTPWKIIAVSVIIGTIFFAGDRHGRRSAESQYVAEQLTLRENLDRANETAAENVAATIAELEAARRIRDAALLALATAAAADPDALTCGLPFTGVLRHGGLTN